VAQCNVAIGGYHLGIRSNDPGIDAALRSILADYVVEDDDTPANYGLLVHGDDGQRREFNILYEGWGQADRSLGVVPLIETLLARLAGYAHRDPAHATLAEAVVVGPHGAAILPMNALAHPQLEARIRRGGLYPIAVAATLDRDRGVIVVPRLDHDAHPLDDLAERFPTPSGSDLPVPFGDHHVTAFVLTTGVANERGSILTRADGFERAVLQYLPFGESEDAAARLLAYGRLFADATPLASPENAPALANWLVSVLGHGKEPQPIPFESLDQPFEAEDGAGPNEGMLSRFRSIFGGQILVATGLADGTWPGVRVGRIVLPPPGNVRKTTLAKLEATDDDIVIRLGRPQPEVLGYGESASTIGVLTALQEHLRPGMKVADLSTRTGLLAIAAALLGADGVDAVDTLLEAREIARENFRRNRVLDRIGVIASSLDGLESPYDLVLADMNSTQYLPVADQVAALVAPGGLLVLACAEGEEPYATAPFEGFDVISRTCHGWPYLGEENRDELGDQCWCVLTLRKG
jgi:hypothetical protein